VLSLILLRDEKKFRHLDKNIEHRYKAAAAAVAAAIAGSLGFSASVHLCGRKIAGHEQNSMDCKGRKKLGRKGKEERHRGKEINQTRKDGETVLDSSHQKPVSARQKPEKPKIPVHR